MDSSVLREYYRPLLRWWWLILLAAIIAPVSAFFFLRDQPDLYQSSTSVVIGQSLEDPNPSSAEFGLTQQLAQAYAEIALKAPLRNATMAALGLKSLPEYTVEAKEDSSLLEISVTAPQPEVAQAVAQELVNQLIQLSPADKEADGRKAFIDEQLTRLENEILETVEEIELAESELGSLFSAREINDTQQRITALQNKERTLRTSYSELLSSAQRNAINRVTVLEPAALPNRPMPSELPLNIALAALMGLVVGATGAYLLEFFDDSVKDGELTQKQLGLPLLASIPISRTKNDLAMGGQTRTALTEAYRELATKLGRILLESGPAILLVTSPTPDDGKSVTVANLGVALARSGRKVTIVDADLHRPRQHEHFGLTNRAGLSTVLKSRSTELEAVVQNTAHPGLSVMTSGPLPANASEYLSSGRMRELLEELRSRSDIVLIDSPPALALVDAVVLSDRADKVLLVFRVGNTRRSAGAKVATMFREVDADVVGFVLNGVHRRRTTYARMYGYGDTRGASAQYAPAADHTPQIDPSGETPPEFVAEPAPPSTKRGGALNSILKRGNGGAGEPADS